MKIVPSRKAPKFYIASPRKDRRREPRFESHENVVIRRDGMNEVAPALAFDIGEKGLRLITKMKLYVGADLEIAFPSTMDHVECFGCVIWTRSVNSDSEMEVGISLDSWHGVTQGADSWKRFRGLHPRNDRRSTSR